MPEIKHHFAKGRMNKDLNERLVPNGEYRDAMNIQVSTSEESDVGTIQNILGNNIVNPGQFSSMGDNFECIGSVADEKTGTIYYFITDVIRNNLDAILEYQINDFGTSSVIPVLLDHKAGTPDAVLKFSNIVHPQSGQGMITGINVISSDKEDEKMLFWTDGENEPKKINIKRCKDGNNPDNFIGYNSSNPENYHTKLVVNNTIDLNPKTVLTTASGTNTTTIPVDDVSGLSIGSILKAIGNTQASPFGFITVVTITDIIGNVITLSHNVSFNNNQPFLFIERKDIKEEHITVIKKKPTRPPVLEIKTSERVGQSGTSIYLQTNIPNSILLLPVGDYIQLPIPTSNYLNIPLCNWEINDVLLLGDSSVTNLQDDYQIRVRIDNILPYVPGSNETVYDCEILHMGSGTPTVDTFKIELEDLTPKIFQKTLPRFAYRYKYEDGEYSAIGPFTEVAFMAGEFVFHATKEPFNAGMEGKIKSIVLWDFVAADIPDDVIQVDLLYKEEDSPNIYSIDSVKPGDPIISGSPYNYWNNPGLKTDALYITPTANYTSNKLLSSRYKGKYEILEEDIYAMLPSDQLLRPWDNVPRKALAQEISGNRLIYGNYLQNFNLIDFYDENVRPTIRAGIKGRNISEDDPIDFYSVEGSPSSSTLNPSGRKSIKSLRSYQLGVVYGDKYGRETPVITSKNSSVSVPCDSNIDSVIFSGNASKSLQIYGTLYGSQPTFAEYYKFFIKETSSEYYNLVMDRVYRAKEDGNLWISFPSSDRNKIQKDDYIILKKPIDSHTEVTSCNNKFKVIDIKSEAPDFIKTKYWSLGEADGDGDLTNIFSAGTSYQPAEGIDTILFDKAFWEDNEFGGKLTQVNGDQLLDVALSVVFKIVDGVNTQYSERYDIVEASLVNSSTHYKIKLHKPIVENDGWVETSTAVLNTSLKMTIWKEQIKDLQEYHGRFFVKILSRSEIENYLVDLSDNLNQSVSCVIQSYYLADAGIDPPPQGGSGISNLSSMTTNQTFNYPGFNFQPAGMDTGHYYSHTYSNWINNLDTVPGAFGGDGIGMWFIDAAFFAAAQPLSSNNTRLSGQLTKGGRFQQYQGQGHYNNQDMPKNAWESNTGSIGSGGERQVFSLEGIVTADNKYDGNAGWRMWKNTTGSSSQSGNLTGEYENGKYYIHLSISGVGEDLHNGSFRGNQPSGTYPDKSYIDLQHINASHVAKGTQTNGSHNTPFDQSKRDNQWEITGPANVLIVNNLYAGNRFKIAEDSSNTIYTITKVKKHHLYNHTPWQRMQKYWDPAWGEIAYMDDGTNTPTNPHSAGRGDSVMEAFDAWADNNYGGSSSNKWQSKPGASLRTNNAFNKAGVNGNNEKYWEIFKRKVVEFGKANNRRVMFVIEVDKDPRTASGTFDPLNSTNGANVDRAIGIQFVTEYITENNELLSNNPAIWETEPKEKSGLNIYHEASQAIPLKLEHPGKDENNTSELFAPIGSMVRCLKQYSTPFSQAFQTAIGYPIVTNVNGTEITIMPGLFTDTTSVLTSGPNSGNVATNSPADQTELFKNISIRFIRDNYFFTTAAIDEVLVVTAGSGGNVGNDYITKIKLKATLTSKAVGLSWYNCISFGNGVESDRIRDDFNQMQLTNGVQASSTIEQQYKEESRSGGLIYSGVYNSVSGINDLNQFIMAQNITKDLNPTYGSIQKLHSRDTNLIALCENKCLKILIDKNALFNADGESQLLSTSNVLGEATPFIGEYGISTDPESFASESYRAYFTDRKNGVVLRLSQDGLTPISQVGMSDYFKDNLRGAYRLIGSHDDYKDNYNLTIDRGEPTSSNTISFNESVKGWISFKSFIPENGISIAGDYHTFFKGKAYKHHSNPVRNIFYGDALATGSSLRSSVTVLLNDSSDLVKNFKTLSYEGSQARIVSNDQDNDYYNLNGKTGWYVDYIVTNEGEVGEENGSLNEFIEKEGKWFNYIRGHNVDSVDLADFTHQGMGGSSNKSNSI